MTEDAISKLISSIYDAAFDRELWSALERDIPLAFGSTSISLMMINKTGVGARFLLQSQNITPDLAREYGQHFNKIDLWSQRGFELGAHRVWTSRDMVDDKSFHKTEFYNDFLRRTDVAYVVGAVWDHSHHETCTFGVQRPLAGGNYDDDVKKGVALFLPHLKRALLIRDRLAPLELERQAALETLELTGVSTFIVTGDAKVIFANSPGEALLRTGEGLHLIGSRLSATDIRAAERLNDLIQTATDTTAAANNARGASLAVPRGDLLPLIVTVAPFRPARGGLGIHAPAAILFVKDREKALEDAAVSCSAHGLTPAETRLSVNLLRLGTLKQAAEASNLTTESARQYMKRIFSKTNTQGQVDLVALLMS